MSFPSSRRVRNREAAPALKPVALLPLWLARTSLFSLANRPPMPFLVFQKKESTGHCLLVVEQLGQMYLITACIAAFPEYPFDHKCSFQYRSCVLFRNVGQVDQQL